MGTSSYAAIEAQRPGQVVLANRNSAAGYVRRAGIACVVASLLAAAAALGAEPGAEFLTGDWGGTRTQWSEAGIDLMLTHIGEYMAVTSGGLAQKGEYLSRTDLGVTLNTEKLLRWKDGTFQFTFMHTDGGQPNDHSGSLQGVSNIEAPATAKLLEAWYDQGFFSGSASLRFGLYDLNTEFDAMETAKMFSNPSFGISPDYSQSGVNGPSIFPTTSLALRARYQSAGNLYAQAAILDGVPGKPGAPRGTYVRLDPQDGWLVAAETGYRATRATNSKERYLKLGVGAWRYTEPLTADVNGNPIGASYSQGFYLISEAHLYRETEGSAKGLYWFLHYGHAGEKLHQIGHYVGGALIYTGLLPGRDEDQLGLGVASASNGQYFLDANPGFESRETIWELAYRARVTPWLSVQPDIQYVENPGTDPVVKNATVASVRVFIAL